MNFLDLIEIKRDGGTLSTEQIHKVVADITSGAAPDYQIAAWLMAVYFRGLHLSEKVELTLAMRDSGERLQLRMDSSRPIVDKHSTGGIGDKVSLPLAPLLAALGFRVPMISGRGLGITGGTLDKLDSIPGFRTQLSKDELESQVEEIGVAMGGQTESMIPADRILYALRDVTGTVPSIPLITASILSKKLAEDLDALILDVKYGKAAFMKTKEDAEELAESITSLGERCGVSTRAILSDMNTPLGRTAGNWLEVKESVDCLNGKGPEDLRTLVLDCAANLLQQTECETDLKKARIRAVETLDSGKALAIWHQLLIAQGADMTAYEELLTKETTANAIYEIRSEQCGTVTECNALEIGLLVRNLGGGRMNKESSIDYGVGVEALVKPGESVGAGDLLARIHCSEPTDEIQSAALRAFRLE